MEAAEKDGNFRVTSLHVCNKKRKKGKTRRAFLGEMLRFLFFSFFGDYFSTIGDSCLSSRREPALFGT
jgi:hypothetical protein